jgi:hypothetical protein
MYDEDFTHCRAAPPRAHRRALLRALRAEGCRCDPSFDEDERVDAEELGGFAGGTVRHDADRCPLARVSPLTTLLLPVDGPGR